MVFALVAIFLQSCFFGFEGGQEPHSNPLDPMYYSYDSRVILSEPMLREGKVRIYWKPAKSTGLLSDDWSYQAYYFDSALLDSVVTSLKTGGDPSGSMTSLSANFNPDDEYENRFFEDGTIPSANRYYIVRFTSADATKPNFSNIVIYKP